MSKALIIAEKPSVAADIARAGETLGMIQGNHRQAARMGHSTFFDVGDVPAAMEAREVVVAALLP